MCLRGGSASHLDVTNGLPASDTAAAAALPRSGGQPGDRSGKGTATRAGSGEVERGPMGTRHLRWGWHKATPNVSPVGSEGPAGG